MASCIVRLIASQFESVRSLFFERELLYSLSGCSLSGLALPEILVKYARLDTACVVEEKKVR